MVQVEKSGYELPTALKEIPLSKTISSPAAYSMIKTKEKAIVLSTINVDTAIEEIETVDGSDADCCDVLEDMIIQEGSNEDESLMEEEEKQPMMEQREGGSARLMLDHMERDSSAAAVEADEREKEEEVEEEENKNDDEDSHEFVPHRADGHTYFEACMKGLDGTPTSPNATRNSVSRSKSGGLRGSLRRSISSNKGKKKDEPAIKKPTSTAATVAPMGKPAETNPKDEEPKRGVRRSNSGMMSKKEIKKPTSTAATIAPVGEPAPYKKDESIKINVGDPRKESLKKPIPKPTGSVAEYAADNESVITATFKDPEPEPEPEKESDESHEFVPHRADGLTYFEACMQGLEGTPTAGASSGKPQKKKGFRKNKK